MIAARRACLAAAGSLPLATSPGAAALPHEPYRASTEHRVCRSCTSTDVCHREYGTSERMLPPVPIVGAQQNLLQQCPKRSHPSSTRVLHAAQSEPAVAFPQPLIEKDLSYHIATNSQQSRGYIGKFDKRISIEKVYLHYTFAAFAKLCKLQFLPCQGRGRGFESLRPLQLNQ